MSDVCEDLRDSLLIDLTVARLVEDRMYVNVVPAGTDVPFVWIQRRGVEYLDALGEVEATPYRELVDIECVSDGAIEMMELTDAVRVALNGARGTVGQGVYSWVTVRDQAEDYVVRNMADQHLFIGSLDVEAIRP